MATDMRTGVIHHAPVPLSSGQRGVMNHAHTQPRRPFPHHEAYFSTLLTELPLVSLTLEPGRHFHFGLENCHNGSLRSVYSRDRLET